MSQVSHTQFTNSTSIPKLDSKDQALCDKSITINELFETLKKFKKDKSPGLDGLTAEFYLEFWECIKMKLMEVYEESYANGTLPESMTTGVIVLLEKKGKDRMKLANWRPITLLGVDYKLLTKTLAERLKLVLPKLIHPDQNGFVPGGSIFSSTHTVRDILFYCNKEKIDLVMLALDYTKAFDSVEFGFIHEAFKAFNFGEQFKKWINVLYKGGRSCISNNGFLSSTFPIERSTRQGDPISPLVFILVLEILFICIRENGNIRGIKILKNEIKLTSFADDATYFLNDKDSAEVLLNVIVDFSKVSGLEINKTKSECLLLDFEMDLASTESELCGIPIVENLKILGHYFGKNRTICEYQNYYSKLCKFDRITGVWKQRGLSLFGRNLLINSLLNSLFLFNAQVEIPPIEFIKIVNAKNKNFLWDGGVAKIAHHSLIGAYDQGGIKYKDIETTIQAVNMKFLLRINCETTDNSVCLPKYWMMKLFKIPTQGINREDNYTNSFFSSHLNLIDCNFTLPSRSKWTGHPFYWNILNTRERLLEYKPKSFESIISTPLWFNKMLGTTFDSQLSKLGFNFVADLYYNNKRVKEKISKDVMINTKLLNLKNKLDSRTKNVISESLNKVSMIYPYLKVSFKNQDKVVNKMDSKELYYILISNKIRIPKGLLDWCWELELSEQQIKTSLTFAFKCSLSTKDRVFQYKISTNILPTNEYLKRYKIKDSDQCDSCNLECDTIVHSLYECELKNRLVEQMLDFLRVECSQPKISMVEYLFGKEGEEHLALNHILLELKKDHFLFRY